MNLSLSNYGSLIARYTSIMNRGNILFLKYDRELKENNFGLVCSGNSNCDIPNIVDLNNKPSFYNVEIIDNTNNKRIKKLKNITGNDNTVKINSFDNDHLPIFYNYNNCKKEGNSFLLNIEYSKNKIATMYFDKNVGVMKSNSRIITKENINNDKVLEEYLFHSNGYLCTNFVEINKSSVYNEDFIEYKLFKKLKNNTGNCILDASPTNIIFPNNSVFCSFDNLGLMVSCYIDNNRDVNYCRQERYDKDKYISIKSIHPLVYDPFDPILNINKPDYYWCINKYSNNNGYIEFDRDIYKIMNSTELLKN